MAEFSEIMRQFDRMCKAHAGCVDCPLAIKGTVETKCSISSFVEEPEYIEREVTAWAAEHPEPKYQSWGEWLSEIGVFQCEDGEWRFAKANDPIPADIAQMLGLQPKEVDRGT